MALVLLVAVFALSRIYRNSINFNSVQQGGIWNILAVVLMAVGLVSFFHISRKPRVFLPMFFYAIVVFCMDLLHADRLGVNNVYYALTTPFFVFVVFAFYAASPAPSRSVVWLHRLVFFLISAVLLYVLFHFRSGSLEGLLLADVYYALCFLPLFMMYEPNTPVKVSSIILVALLVVLSEKRAGVIGFLMFLACQYLLDPKNARFRGRFLKALLLSAVLGLCFLVYAVVRADVGSRLFTRMGLLVETGGAGRANLYQAIWQAFLDSSLQEELFGHGRGSIVAISGVSLMAAHDDFLHVLYVYGLIPFFAFCTMYFSLFREWREMKKWGYPQSHLFLGGLLLSGLLSLFSTFCVAFGYVTCAAAFWGVALADWHKFKRANGGA